MYDEPNLGAERRAIADWLFMGFCFAVGALLGAGLGLALWIRAWSPGNDNWIAGGLLLGIPALIGGVFGARIAK